MNIFIIIIILCIILLVLLYYNYIHTNVYDGFANNNMIDAYIYINLENREDRKKLLLDEFNKINIPENKTYKISGVPIPKNGHKGCIQSHILALEMAKLNNWKMVAVFEDDFQINIEPEEFKRLVNKALQHNPFDIIIIHGSNKKEKQNIDDDIYYLEHSTQSTAYIIKNHYYDKLLNIFKYCNDMMNHSYWGDGTSKWEPYALDQKWNELIRKDNWITFHKDIAKQRNISSSINN